MITRRGLITGLGAGAVATFIPKLSWANREAGPLAMPPLLDATGTGRFRLAAQSGQTNFLGNTATETWGFNQAFLGPTVRVANKGAVQAEVENRLNEAMSVHWHGLVIPGDVDGGPHQPLHPGPHGHRNYRSTRRQRRFGITLIFTAKPRVRSTWGWQVFFSLAMGWMMKGACRRPMHR